MTTKRMNIVPRNDCAFVGKESFIHRLRNTHVFKIVDFNDYTGTNVSVYFVRFCNL